MNPKEKASRRRLFSNDDFSEKRWRSRENGFSVFVSLLLCVDCFCGT
jgi:hypothetical protein